MLASNTLMQLLIAALLGGIGVLIVSKIVPSFELKGGFGTAMVVGLVYGVLKALLQKILIIVTFPAVILTLGLFILVINAFLLWVTDRLIDGFEVKTKAGLLVGALLLSILDLAFALFLRGGAIF